MEPQAAGKEAVLEGDLHEVVLGDPGGREHARGERRPVLDVVLRVSHHDGPPGSPRRGVDADDVFQRHREHVVGIAGVQVLLRGERQLLEVAHRTNLPDINPGGIEALPVERHIPVHPVERHLQALDLELLQLVARHGFA